MINKNVGKKIAAEALLCLTPMTLANYSFAQVITINSNQQHSANYSVTIGTSGCNFEANSKALTLHQAINNVHSRGNIVRPVDIEQLFLFLASEKQTKVSSEFILSYATKYNQERHLRAIILYLMPTSSKGPFDIDLVKKIASSLFNNASVSQRRNLFLCLREHPALDARALSLALCASNNIDPKVQYQPAEIIRATQQLLFENRERGDEFRLGIMLREALKNSKHITVSYEELDRLKMPLIRWMQTFERQNRGSMEALSNSSSVLFEAYLNKVLNYFVKRREEIKDRKLFGINEETVVTLHSDQYYTHHAFDDFAKSFGASFKLGHVCKGSTDISDPQPKNRFYGLVNWLSNSTQIEGRIWLSMHGSAWYVHFHSGEQGLFEEGQGSPHHVIGSEELGQKLASFKAQDNLVIIADTCNGWEFAEFAAGEIIKSKLAAGEKLEGMSKQPIFIAASQNGMPSKSYIVQWFDGRLPASQRKTITNEHSMFMQKLIAYCQAKTQGIELTKLTELGPTEGKPYTCSFGDFFEIDHLLAIDLENNIKEYWSNSEGQLIESKKINSGVDPAVFWGEVINFRKVSISFIEELEKEGFLVPKFPLNTKGWINEERPSDNVLELSSKSLMSYDRLV